MSEQALEAPADQRRASRAERQAYVERLPWVTRLRLPWPCDGIRWGAVSLRDLYEWGPRANRNPPRGIQPKARCKKTARWSYASLDWSHGLRYLVGPSRKTRRYCWDHLISAGIYGSQEETDRVDRWYARHPAELPFEGEERK